MYQRSLNPVILYHADCPDGFGAAFAAWKKFGHRAAYIPVQHGKPYPDGLEKKEVYICDFSYPDDILLEIEKIAKRLVVLDHHLSAREWVERVREYIFDNNRSGAGITWDYLHQDKKRPVLINYIEDGDLYRYALPNARALLAYIYNQPRNFETWDKLLTALESEEKRNNMLRLGEVYDKHFKSLVEKIAAHAELVSFEGYVCYLASAPKMFATDVGNLLARKNPPFALVVRAETDGIVVSMRSDGTVNVANIAKTYGGGGHSAAAGFRIGYGEQVPWKLFKSKL